jgi:hypothetical protein
MTNQWPVLRTFTAARQATRRTASGRIRVPSRAPHGRYHALESLTATALGLVSAAPGTADARPGAGPVQQLHRAVLNRDRTLDDYVDHNNADPCDEPDTARRPPRCRRNPTPSKTSWTATPPPLWHSRWSYRSLSAGLFRPIGSTHVGIDLGCTPPQASLAYRRVYLSAAAPERARTAWRRSLSILEKLNHPDAVRLRTLLTSVAGAHPGVR